MERRGCLPICPQAEKFELTFTHDALDLNKEGPPPKALTLLYNTPTPLTCLTLFVQLGPH